MAAAPTLSGAHQGSTAMADLGDAVDSKISPGDNIMAPLPSGPSPSPSPPSDSGSGSKEQRQHQQQRDAKAQTAPEQRGVSDGARERVPSGLAAGEDISPDEDVQGAGAQLAALKVQDADGLSNAHDQNTSGGDARSHHLYIGNLSPKVTEEYLHSLFSEHVSVLNVKILIHHHPQYPPQPAHHHQMYGPYGAPALVAPQMVPGQSNYGFVEVADAAGAQRALDALDGRKLYDMHVKVSWAKQQRGIGKAAQGAAGAAAAAGGGADGTGGAAGGSGRRARDRASSSGAAVADDASSAAGSSFAAGLHHVFVGDLSAEVNDARLREHFASKYASLHEARVMWDMHSGKSRGYGFLAFKRRDDAEAAIRDCAGDRLGGRAIRVNWANQKGGASAQAAAAGPAPQSNQQQAKSTTADDALSLTASVIAEAGAGSGAAARPLQHKVGWGSATRNTPNLNRQHAVQQQVAMQVGLARTPMNSYNTPVYAFGQTPPSQTGPPRPAPVPVQAQADAKAGGSGAKSTGTSSSDTRKGSFTSAGASPSLASRQAHAHQHESSGPLTYEAVLQQTPAYNTTVYIGNLPPQTTQQDITPLFASLGVIIEVRMQSDRGYGFVKLDTHENAAQAIVELNGSDFGGRAIKCAWGKDRTDSLGALGMRPPPASLHPSAAAMGMPANGMGMMYPVMPQFGFGGGFAFPGMMPMAPGFGPPHMPNMAAAAQMQQQIAAMQAAQAAAHAQHQQHQHQHQQQQQQQQAGSAPPPSGAVGPPQPPYAALSSSPGASMPEGSALQLSPLPGEPAGLPSSGSAQDLSLTDPFYPGRAYSSFGRGSYDASPHGL